MKSQRSARLCMIFSMLVFGTVGIFVRQVSLPSSVIALVRGVIGTAFLLVFSTLRKTKVDRSAIRANLLLLILSGVCIGFNWILLFEAYRYTTVATATLCYYLAPVFIILCSPLVLKERLTLSRLLCVFGALAGMVLVSGAAGLSSSRELIGVMFGVGAATLYATAVLMNKKMGEISGFDRTLVQLASASAALLPYVLLTEKLGSLTLTKTGIIPLLVLGVLHTGVCYALYFLSLKDLSAQSSSILSYIDPVFAVILSAVLLKEPMTWQTAVGAVLVLGCMIISELNIRKKLP
ncbi:MAG: DMT family transporter [Clostridia bacterium]|nr:DMT family transporter [Clostridia bacterium]